MLCTEKMKLLDLIISHNPLKPVELNTAVRENVKDLALVKDYSHHVIVCEPTDPALSLQTPITRWRKGPWTMAEESATGSRQGLVLVLLNTKWWWLLCYMVPCISRAFLVQENPLVLSNWINCFDGVIFLLAKELCLVLDPSPAWWAAYAVWFPSLASQLLLLSDTALLLSDPVIFIINCFLSHSVYDMAFSISVAWSWGSHIISCCLISMLPNTAAAPSLHLLSCYCLSEQLHVLLFPSSSCLISWFCQDSLPWSNPIVWLSNCMTSSFTQIFWLFNYIFHMSSS